MFVTHFRPLLAFIFLLALTASTALADNPSVTQAIDLQKSGLSVDALRTLVDAKATKSSDESIENEIERIVSSGLPSTMPRDLFAGLPVDVSEMPSNLGLTAGVKPFVPSDAQEPQHGTPYPRICYIFRPSHRSSPIIGGQGADWEKVQVFCRVHYVDDQDADLALRTGQLLLLGRQALMAHTHRTPFNADDHAIDVWQCRSGD